MSKQQTINTLDKVAFIYRDDGKGDVYHTGAQCFVSKFEYDPNSRTGLLFMSHGSCCDMTGCIQWFQTIDPEVKVIRTFDGTEPDTIYVRDDRGEPCAWWIGKWISGCPKEHARLIAAAEQEDVS